MAGQKRKASAMTSKAKKARKSRKMKIRRNPTYNKTSVKSGLGFPKRMVMTHRYSEAGSMTSSTTLGRYSFHVNSMFDPNHSGVGHQPLYFDQMAVLYNLYTVIGAKCVFKVFPLTSVANSVLVAGYINDNTAAAAASNWNTIAEQSQAKRTIMIPLTGKPATITLKWSGRKAWGKGFLQNPQLSADTGNDPAEKQYFDFYTIAADGSTATTVRWEVMITYIAVWRELREVSES